MPETTGAESVTWNLDHLFSSDAAALEAMQQADAEAQAFADAHRGALATTDAAEFAEALLALEAIQDTLGRAFTYAYLRWVTATEDAERGAFLQKVREAYTATNQHLLFLEVEWARLDDARAQELLKDPALEGFRHHLELGREAREHVLSEPEEKVMSEKAVTGRSAWTRYFDETLSAARFAFRSEVLTEQEVLAKLSDADRDVRRDAALALTEGLKELQRPLAFVFNTVLADKASSDRLRGYDHWLAARNQANEIEQPSVDALVEAVTSRYDLAQRYYRLKGRLLGLEPMMDYDRYAPVGGAEPRFSWDEAQAAVLDAYRDFHPQMGAITQEFFDGRWIDAAVRPGKRGGAFSHGAVPSAHPYILMNYTGKARDVQTLAHELGHGVHQYLAREQGVFQSDTPLTTAETASVFGEMLTFQRLLKVAPSDEARLTLLVRKIDDSMATVFRQVTMNRFEDAIHAHRREQGELSPEDFAEHWMTTQQALYGDAVTLGEHYAHWWSYIPHFLHTPGYVYAYAFGELLVLALYARYRDGLEGFAEKYLDLLAAGGSDWPHALLEPFGIDLRDPGFWTEGLEAIETLVAEAEGLA